MALPTPEPGLVIRYSYLWHSESLKGAVDGVKDRPCAIIITTLDIRGDTLVSVVPITHLEPSDPDVAIEIPEVTKNRLGLADKDNERSWVILNERNEFLWPGPDIRPVSRDNSDVEFGLLPPEFYEQLKEKILELAEQDRTSKIERTE